MHNIQQPPIWISFFLSFVPPNFNFHILYLTKAFITLSNILLGQNFDAVVGDITITANRSTFVDFTLPYTESGVSLVVPIKDNGTRNAWIFLKPLSRDLWITSGCFFVFIGFVVWVLEHRINDDFRGPPAHQIGTSLWYSFSTMVFAQRKFQLFTLSHHTNLLNLISQKQSPP